jgi:hypothetical protein
MTKNQATALRLRWAQRAYPISCEHTTLETELTGEAHVTGKYICVLCGELVARLETLSRSRAKHRGQRVSQQPARASK